MKPDASLTKPCDRPELQGETYRDLVESYLARGKAIDECNDRLEALRQ